MREISLKFSAAGRSVQIMVNGTAVTEAFTSKNPVISTLTTLRKSDFMDEEVFNKLINEINENAQMPTDDSPSMHTNISWGPQGFSYSSSRLIPNINNFFSMFPQFARTTKETA